jgi:hypothetical protein
LETAENILGFREIRKRDWIPGNKGKKLKKDIQMTLNRSKRRSKKLKLQKNMG